MRHGWPLTLGFALALVGATQAATFGEADERLSVLLLTGANNHDWEWTAPSLVSILEESGRFEVTRSDDPSVALKSSDGLSAYDVFVLDYNGPRWGEPAESNFLKAVREGVGVVVIHASNNAFPGWTEYELIAGLCWREGTGHGSFHPFDVYVTDRDHPITRGLPNLRGHPDELYHRLVPTPGAENHVLAQAFSDPKTGGTDVLEPMVIVQSYGEGRVFHTPLGHVWRGVAGTRVSHVDPQFRNLVVRGTEWAATGYVTDGRPQGNRLTDLETIAGWEMLFEGEDLSSWRARGGGSLFAGPSAILPPGWSVVDGCLVLGDGGKGEDLVSRQLFEDFELEWEWKVVPGSNSGVKVRVPTGSAIGPEYQILDDAHHQDGGLSQTSAGSLYGLTAPEGKQLSPLGSFNHGRILARGPRLEHWLNGSRLLAEDLSSDGFEARRAKSKFAEVPSFGLSKGHVLLQDHGDEAWFRSIRVRSWPPPGEDVDLFDGATLKGWEQIGDADWTLSEEDILGEVGGGAQSFLVSERSFGDFILEVDVRNEAPGNSGIQVRSHVNDSGRLVGYQIEIDPSERAWSGGLYDEGRRGWLDDLEEDEAARNAFEPGEWNRYRIECIGPSLRAWVNGIPTTDYLDGQDMEGSLALQVHSGNNTKVRWRNPRLIDLGSHRWADVLSEMNSATGSRVDFQKSEEEGLVLETEDWSRLSFAGDEQDGTFRLLCRVRKGSLLLGARRLAEDPPPFDGEARETWKRDGTSGWLIRPDLEEGKWHEVTVYAYGDRLALDVDGRRQSEVRGVPGPDAGRFTLEIPAGGAVDIRRLDRLVR